MLRGVARRPKVLAQRPVTSERKTILSSYGAELVLTDPLDGSDGAVREARRLNVESPEHYFYADREGVVVTILCDSGEWYLSERFWDE